MTEERCPAANTVQEIMALANLAKSCFPSTFKFRLEFRNSEAASLLKPKRYTQA